MAARRTPGRPRGAGRRTAKPAEQSEARSDVVMHEPGKFAAPEHFAGTHTSLNANAGGRMLKVVHAAVGPYREGSEVSENAFGEGADIDRLLSLGAVRFLTRDEQAESGGEPNPIMLNESPTEQTANKRSSRRSRKPDESQPAHSEASSDPRGRVEAEASDMADPPAGETAPV